MARIPSFRVLLRLLPRLHFVPDVFVACRHRASSTFLLLLVFSTVPELHLLPLIHDLQRPRRLRNPHRYRSRCLRLFSGDSLLLAPAVASFSSRKNPHADLKRLITIFSSSRLSQAPARARSASQLRPAEAATSDIM
jgi:hypothetical protein